MSSRLFLPVSGSTRISCSNDLSGCRCSWTYSLPSTGVDEQPLAVVVRGVDALDVGQHLRGEIAGHLPLPVFLGHQPDARARPVVVGGGAHHASPGIGHQGLVHRPVASNHPQRRAVSPAIQGDVVWLPECHHAVTDRRQREVLRRNLLRIVERAEPRHRGRDRLRALDVARLVDRVAHAGHEEADDPDLLRLLVNLHDRGPARRDALEQLALGRRTPARGRSCGRRRRPCRRGRRPPRSAS